jgi:arabinose-5-phosphate isomerase
LKGPAVLRRARRVLLIEAEAVRRQASVLGKDFAKAVDMISRIRGRLAIIGIGKSGLIGRKLAATLSSTGTSAIFMHPVESLHGDLGMLSSDDIVLALSYSGQTEEIKRVLPYIRSKGLKIIAMTGKVDSPLAAESDLVIPVPVPQEACPYNITPTASTTAMLAVGDALAIVLMEGRGFGKEDFAKLHPAGTLGKVLNLRVRDLMHKGKDNPVVSGSTKVSDAIAVMTKTKLGAASIVDAKGKLIGFFTDGDLRRLLPKDPGLLKRRIEEVMTKKPLRVEPELMAIEAARLLQKHRIDNLPVVDPASGKPVGILDERDVLAAGLQ